MGWPNDPRPAKCLVTLRNQINALSPHRSVLSDGMLASGAHTQANPTSDHEPRIGDNGIGVVTAIDITHDPAQGIDSESLAEALRTAKDDRIKYIISNKKIASGTDQDHPAWQWRTYTGKNPHNHHVHISVKSNKGSYDSITPWVINLAPAAAQVAAPPPVISDPRLREGASGANVVHLQTLLNTNGATLVADGDFGNATKMAVRMFQHAKGLVEDGVVGPQTWIALKA
jgi:hypothetical protein